jgi:hypothetical protein
VQVIGVSPNPGGRADGNRKLRGSRSLTFKRVGRHGLTLEREVVHDR